jgi:hypothetical protein
MRFETRRKEPMLTAALAPSCHSHSRSERRACTDDDDEEFMSWIFVLFQNAFKIDDRYRCNGALRITVMLQTNCSVITIVSFVI